MWIERWIWGVLHDPQVCSLESNIREYSFTGLEELTGHSFSYRVLDLIWVPNPICDPATSTDRPKELF